MNMPRFVPDPDLWGELMPELPVAVVQAAWAFDRYLDPGWSVCVRPYLNGLRPDLVLFHPRYGFGVYDVVDAEAGGVAGYETITDPAGDRAAARALYSDGALLVGLANPWDRVLETRSHLARLTVNVIPGSSGFGLITVGLLVTEAAAARGAMDALEAYAGDLLRRYRHNNLIVRLGSLQDGQMRAVLPRARGVRGQAQMMPDVARLGERALWPDSYEGVALGFEWDADQARLVEQPPPPGTRMRRVRGPAGSGKSIVIAGRAARLALEGQSVLIVYYNVALRNYLIDLVARLVAARPGFTASERLEARGRVVVHHYHEWLHSFGGVGASDRGDFDAVLVDEGQDFDPEWWHELRDLAWNGQGEMFFVADASQDLYGHREQWTDVAMTGAGFRGGWTRLRKNYRVPFAFVPALKDYAARFMDRGPVDPPSDGAGGVQGGLGDSYPLVTRWVQVGGDVGPALVAEALRLVERSHRDGRELDVAILMPSWRAGERFGFDLRAAYDGPVSSVFACPRRDSCSPEVQCVGCPRASTEDHRRRVERTLRLGFGRELDAVHVSTYHSFKGWESRHLLVYVESLAGGGSYDAVGAFYVALTRLLRHERGSALTVVSCCPELAEWGRRWFDEYVTEYQVGNVARSLDLAAAAVLDGAGRLDDKVARRGVQSLMGLRTGGHPQYASAAVPLAYLCRYQLGQVNLAYSLFGARMARGSDMRRGVELLDVGAGALAGLVGLLLAVADRLEVGDEVGELRYWAVEPARAMSGMGLAFVQAWRQVVKGSVELRWVAEALARLVPGRCSGDVARFERSGVAPLWVSAFHALYGDSVSELRRSLQSVVADYVPEWVLLTANASKRGLAQSVCDGWPGWTGPAVVDEWRLAEVLPGSAAAEAGDRLGLTFPAAVGRRLSYGVPTNVLWWERSL